MDLCLKKDVQTRRESVRSFGALEEVVAKDRIYRCVIKGLYRCNLSLDAAFIWQMEDLQLRRNFWSFTGRTSESTKATMELFYTQWKK
ncbi:hypothetical protein CAEBREN_09438 [Caenorhabditis brenneri]|uniref:Uncharacterized protein n=1 Tax=Caenorhabditis brenneri TaxID=135651 RepID=G0ND90_CAEBE|nr:hypothetical protein CAEBREN_09438 [Caenorhabditis brenneri]